MLKKKKILKETVASGDTKSGINIKHLVIAVVPLVIMFIYVLWARCIAPRYVGDFTYTKLSTFEVPSNYGTINH